jgi:MoaA/NifB/PqqE/SkfB family radical SAM enzyme
VPARLVKFIGVDNGYMRKFRCPEPFTRFDIGPNGDVSVCCGHWVHKQIGNFTRDSIDSIVNSPSAIKIRDSIVDGSYKYCNHLECRPMIQETLPIVNEDENFPKKSLPTQHVIEQVLFAYDQSCNLSCPSCRREKIMEKTSEVEEKVKAVTEKLLPIMSSLNTLNINPAGELFASKASRRLLDHISDKTCPNLQIEIISNGTLFSELEWNKFPGIHNKIKSVRISIDAASKRTFESLRRLAVYEPFLENMHFLSRLRSEGIIPQLQFSFTYQLNNFREMEDFVLFGKDMGADLVVFERLQNLGAYSDEEYCRLAIHKPDHVDFLEFKSVIGNSLLHQPFVMNDFEY